MEGLKDLDLITQGDYLKDCWKNLSSADRSRQLNEYKRDKTKQIKDVIRKETSRWAELEREKERHKRKRKNEQGDRIRTPRKSPKSE